MIHSPLLTATLPPLFILPTPLYLHPSLITIPTPDHCTPLYSHPPHTASYSPPYTLQLDTPFVNYAIFVHITTYLLYTISQNLPIYPSTQTQTYYVPFPFYTPLHLLLGAMSSVNLFDKLDTLSVDDINSDHYHHTFH